MAIVLLRSPSKNDRYQSHIAANLDLQKSDVVHVPVISHTVVDIENWSDALRSHDYSGIIITSQRAVEALKQAKERYYSLVEKMPIYVVGPGTSEAVKKLGFKVFGASCGNAEILASYICDSASSDSHFLFLTGEVRRDVLPATFLHSNVALTQQIVYSTFPSQDSLIEVQKAIGKTKTDWVIFFSSQGTEEIADYLRSNRNVKIGSIGPTTASFLKSRGIDVQAVATKPTPESLCQAIMEFDRSVNFSVS